MRCANEHGRSKFLVEHQGAVMHLDDAGYGQADIDWLRGLADLVSQARMGDLDFLLYAEVGGGIDDGFRADHIAGGVFRLLGAHLAKVVRARRHGEPDELTRSRLRRCDRRRRRALGGKIKQTSVRHDSRGPAERELALLSQIPVDLERRESPRIGGYVTCAAFERVFEITIALLKMVRPKKEALRPVNFCVPRHRPQFLIRSRSHRSFKASVGGWKHVSDDPLSFPCPPTCHTPARIKQRTPPGDARRTASSWPAIARRRYPRASPSWR